jgi:hypothetical protein
MTDKPDFSKSNMALMIGGQVLVFVLIVFLVNQGGSPISFPANAMRKILSNTQQAK